MRFGIAASRLRRLGRDSVLGAALLLLMSVMSAQAQGAAPAELPALSALDQGLRFLTFQDPAVRFAVGGAALLGISCGLLGSFLVVRRLALVGDALSHAVLPGVAAGFLWNQTKSPTAIFIGAVAAGLIGTTTVGWIQRTTRLKEDTALGLVLAGFYAAGICLVTMIQRLPTGNKSGIDKFLFGQAAAISGGDLRLIAGVTVITVILVSLLYKELLVTSFDPGFAGAAGFPVRLMHDGLMLLLAFATVSALQAVGVVLVSAMLVTPAAAAYLLTDRFHRMLVIAAVIGAATGVIGCFLSFLRVNLPTGPLMVLAASAVFAAAFLFAPRHGLTVRWWKARSHARRVQRENVIKAMFHLLEERGFRDERITFRELAERRRETIEDVTRQARELARHKLVTLDPDGQVVSFTPAGSQRAAEVVRNHRLWELYLTSDAQIATDHVHDDAERIEHVLKPEVVRELEKRLDYAEVDPHGKSIPQVERGRAAMNLRSTGRNRGRTHDELDPGI